MIKRNISVPNLGSPSMGIVRYLASQHRVNNAYDNDLIDLYYDSTGNSERNIRTIFSIINGDWWGTNSSTEHWITIDFLSFRVSVSSYRTSCSPKHYHRKWYIFSSNDNITWTMIHNVSLENEPKKNMNDFYLDTSSYPSRFIKFYTNVQKFDGNWDLVLGYLDYFGTVTYYFNVCSMKKKEFCFLYSIFILSLIS